MLLVKLTPRRRRLCWMAALVVSMQIVGASLLAIPRWESPASRLLHRSLDGVLVYERGRGSLHRYGLLVLFTITGFLVLPPIVKAQL